MQLQDNVRKKTKKTRGISQYLVSNEDDDDDDSDFDDDGDGDDVLGDKSMTTDTDPSKLIDLELVNLLKFCDDLRCKHKASEEY